MPNLKNCPTQFFIKVKQLGKRRPVLDRRIFMLQNLPEMANLRDFLTAIVRSEAQRFNEKVPEKPVTPFLTTDEISDGIEAGKVGFGAKYSGSKTSVEKAVDLAILAFEDGLFAVFLDDNEVKTLDSPILLTENSEVVFVRLAFLRGQ